MSCRDAVRRYLLGTRHFFPNATTRGVMIHAVAGLLALVQLQTMVPIEHPVEAAERIRQLCPMASPRDHRRLSALEQALDDSTRSPHLSPGTWERLGCVRALLAVNAALDEAGMVQRPFRVTDTETAIRSLRTALDLQPDDAQAAELLAAVSQAATSGPTAAPPMLLDDLAMTMRKAVLAGITSPDVLRACTRLLIAVGDIAAAHDCSDRAMRVGSDSTWHLLRLARVSFADDDLQTGGRLFTRALLSAHDSTSTNELLHPFFVEANWAQWAALPDAARERWLADSLLPPEDPSSRPVMTRIAQQLDEFGGGGGRSYYWWCWTEAPASCREPSVKGETVIHTPVRITRFWDTGTSMPMLLFSYGLRTGDLLMSRKGRSKIADVEMTIHLWDEATHHLTDTTLSQHVTVPAGAPADAFVSARVAVPAPAGLSSWAIRVWQSDTRRGRSADNLVTPLATGPLQLSDLLFGIPAADSAQGAAGTGFIPAPMGYVKHGKPLQLFFQIQSDRARSRLAMNFTIQREVNGRIEDPTALNSSYRFAASVGLSQYSPVLPAAKLRPGVYQLRILLLDEATGVIIRRETSFYVE